MVHRQNARDDKAVPRVRQPTLADNAPTFTDDAARLSTTRERRACAEETRLPADGSVPLLLAGAARLEAATPLGPFAVATLRAPALVELRRATGGDADIAEVVLEPGAESVLLPADDARALLFDPGEDGRAFRRLALASVATAIRDTNATMKSFFDSFASAEKPARDASGAFPALKPALKPVSLDPSIAYDLFDAAGINPEGLPDLGLVARSLDAEAPLMRTGASADEAYLLGEGKLRVSMRIPGVGEEALAILSPGEIVGEMALIDDSPRSADVRAHGGPAQVWALSRAVFRGLLESGDPAGAPLLAGIALALGRRHEEAIRRAAAFRVLSGF